MSLIRPGSSSRIDAVTTGSSPLSSHTPADTHVSRIVASSFVYDEPATLSPRTTAAGPHTSSNCTVRSTARQQVAQNGQDRAGTQPNPNSRGFGIDHLLGGSGLRPDQLRRLAELAHERRASVGSRAMGIRRRVSGHLLGPDTSNVRSETCGRHALAECLHAHRGRHCLHDPSLPLELRRTAVMVVGRDGRSVQDGLHAARHRREYSAARTLEQDEVEMRNVIANEWVSLDGVAQAPGEPDEDTSGGFEHGGWHLPYFDEA